MAQIFLRFGQNKELCVQTDKIYIKDVLHQYLDITHPDFYVVSSGRTLSLDRSIEDGACYHVVPRVLGGKGGFGSMLRAIGAQIDKTKSREACRDLSGRRMRDVNNEKNLREWVSKRAEREQEKEDKRRARIERVKAGPRHTFDDPKYMAQKTEVGDRLEDALEQGIKKAMGAGSKRKGDAGTGGAAKKKASDWIGLEGMDELSDSSDSSDDMTEEEQLALAKAISHYEQLQRDGHQDSGSSSDGGAEASSSSTPTPAAKDDTVLPTAEKSGPLSDVTQEGGEAKAECGVPCGDATVVVDAGLSVENGGEKMELGGDDEGSGEAAASTTAAAAVVDASQKVDSKQNTQTPVSEPSAVAHIVLDDYASAGDLEKAGLDALKAALMERGLKCGGTLQERAKRLFSVKGLAPGEYDPALLAKGKGGKGKKSK